MSRLNQAIIQSYYAKLNVVLVLIENHKQKIPGGRRRLCGHALFVKQLKDKPDTSNYSKYEVALKRHLVRIGHRMHGHKESVGEGILSHLRGQYPVEVMDFEHSWNMLMKRLSDVDIKLVHLPIQPLNMLG